MKTSLDHLPEERQQQLRTLTQLICDTTVVEMIILFGSYARGDQVEDPVGEYFSDLDVLVIVRSPNLVEKHNTWSSIENKARHFLGRTTLNLIVHDIRDINFQLEQGWYFFSDVKKEGILLYDSGSFTLADAKPQPLEKRLAYAQACFDEYFGKADDFYMNFDFCLQRQRYKVAAFELHQATETYYKAFLLVVTAYRPKEHNIQALGHQCGNLNPVFRGIFPREDPDDKRRFKLLKAAYVDARYSLTYSITREDLEALAERVKLLRERTETACREHIQAMAQSAQAAQS